MFLTTKENSLNLEGGYYYIEKNSSAWRIKGKKEIKDKSITSGGFGSTFPTVGTAVSNLLKDESKSNWGFVKDENDISNFCGNSCGSGTATTNSFKGIFSWNEGDSGSVITDWMGNFGTLFTSVFNGENLHLEGFKGSWTTTSSLTPLSSS